MPLFRILLIVTGLSPTFFCLLIAAVLWGKPQPCQSENCPQGPYGSEVLIMPALTGLPFICGLLAGRLPKRNTQVKLKKKTEEPKDAEPVS
jgi:hypothetical protein